MTCAAFWGLWVWNAYETIFIQRICIIKEQNIWQYLCKQWYLPSPIIISRFLIMSGNIYTLFVKCKERLLLCVSRQWPNKKLSFNNFLNVGHNLSYENRNNYYIFMNIFYYIVTLYRFIEIIYIIIIFFFFKHMIVWRTFFLT